jgi:hypothetical protein
MKKCSPSLATKEIQIKTTLRFHLTPVRMATIKNNNNDKFWQGFRGKTMLTHCRYECKLVQPLWKEVWRVLKKLKIDLPSDPAIPLLGMYPKKCKSGYNKDTFTSMFIATLFTLAKLWIQPKMPYH